MNKHEALEALEKAHKYRKHADRIEREAHDILDKHEEHEATAAVHSVGSPKYHHAIAAAHGIAQQHHMTQYHDHLAAAHGVRTEARKNSYGKPTEAQWGKINHHESRADEHINEADYHEGQKQVHNDIASGALHSAGASPNEINHERKKAHAYAKRKFVRPSDGSVDHAKLNKVLSAARIS